MLNQKYLDAIAACQQCIVDCSICLHEMATKESMNDCPKCCIQCITACRTAIDMMTADSKWAKDYVKLCKEICEWCYSQCKEHNHDHCQCCAVSCKTCIEVLEKIAA